MMSFAFRARDIVIILVSLSAAVFTPFISIASGIPLSAPPFVGIACVIGSVLIDAFYNAKRVERQLRSAAYESSTPLSSLRDLVIRDLIASRRELTQVRAEAEELKVANIITQLDRASTIAILRAASRPTKQEVWAERVIACLLGVAGSMIASYAWALLQAGNNT